MQRILIVLTMVLMLGVGMLAGSLLTPSAKAQQATTVDTRSDPYPNQTYTPPTLPQHGVHLRLSRRAGRSFPCWSLMRVIAA